MSLASSALAAQPAARESTILLVDDDPFQAYAHRSALERYFPRIERTADASQALIRIADPVFASGLSLVIVGLRLPGMAGPAFVQELGNRIPGVPILVIGRAGESAGDYTAPKVRFLPRRSSTQELLVSVRAILFGGMLRVA